MERRADTRRKILAGAAVLEWAARDSEFSPKLMRELDRFLVRGIDRELFRLPPRPANDDTAPTSPQRGAYEVRDLMPSMPELEEA